MDSATLAYAAQTGGAAAPPEAKPQLDNGRVRDIVLVRLAAAGKAIARADLARELWPLVSHLEPLAGWQSHLDRDLGALADAGLCDAKAVAVQITDAGSRRATLVLGVNTLPRTWAEAKGARLVAKALGMDGLPPRRLKPLMKPEGLRAAIVQQAFKLKIRGLPTPARLRAALAKLAVTRAFGDSLPAATEGRSGLSAKAGRALAGRLAVPPRDFPTDGRLMTALAMEQAGAARPGLDDLQTALLRRYVTRGAMAAPAAGKKPRREPKIEPQTVGRAKPVQQALRLVPTAVAAPAAVVKARPDYARFVATVRAITNEVADGWAGNRKAFVSRVWQAVHAQHPEWSISEVEFKAMLVEAHRAGGLVLSSADLKDERAMADFQASAIAYKNAIFHFVRVDE
jgi:hypothetical protein